MGDWFSLQSRKRGIMAMYFFVAAFLILFLMGEYGSWNIFLISGTTVFLALAVASFYLTIVVPGIWKLYRSKPLELDEREMGVILNATRASYTIFGVVSLVLLFGIVLSVRYDVLTLTHRGHFSLGLALVMFLDFLIAVLPPSIIAWKEKIVR